MPLVSFTSRGLYVERAGVYIDPWRPVDKAIVTHSHSDHAKYGCKAYLTLRQNEAILRHRLGQIAVQTLEFGQGIVINGVRFSFHPAGHIPGSAQVRIEYQGEIWVFTGDFKVENDGLSHPFEPIACQHFITESTFGLPAFRWQPQADIFASINQWWLQNANAGKTSFIAAYSLGKAQRVINGLDQNIGPVLTHGSVAQMNEAVIAAGFPLAPSEHVTPLTDKSTYGRAMVIAPSSAAGSPWIRQFKDIEIGVASGWMALRGTRRRMAADRGFALSDHADWEGLLQAVKATGAEHIYVTHGYTDVFARYLRELGYDAKAIQTGYKGEQPGEDTEAQPETAKA